MQKILTKENNRQTLWQDGNDFFICSTSFDHSEVMVFAANQKGEIKSFMDLYVDYDNVTDHDLHMARFAKEKQ